MDTNQCTAQGGQWKEEKCVWPQGKGKSKRPSPFIIAETYVFAVAFPLLWYIFFKIQAAKASYIGMAILPAILIGIVLVPIGFVFGWGMYYFTKSMYTRRDKNGYVNKNR